MSKEELERLKQQLKEEEDKLKLEEEIAAIRVRIDKSIEIAKRQDKPRVSSILKNWLQQTGYWNSFVLGIPGIILFEIGLVLPGWYPTTIGGLMIVGGILLTPFLRGVWDDKYRPPSDRKR